MSSEALSNASSTLPSGLSTKRPRVSFTSAAQRLGNTAPTATSTQVTPLEAAQAMRDRHFETLHKDLRPFLKTLSNDVLKNYVSFFHKNERHREMSDDPNHVATSVIKNVKLTLSPMDEVEKSEGYKALHSQLEVEIATIRREWTLKYTNVVHDYNRRALSTRFKHAFCKLLPEAARCFIAEHDVKNYGIHQAVMDLLASYPDEVTAILNDTPRHFLRSYKEANELTVLPMPTVKGVKDLTMIISSLNGPTPREIEVSEAAMAAAAASVEADVAAENLRKKQASAARAAAHARELATPANGGVDPSATNATATTTLVAVANPVTPNRLGGNGGTAITTPPRFTQDSNETNLALETMNIYENGDAMDTDIAMPEIEIIGGRSTITHLLYRVIHDGTHKPMEEFRRLHAAYIIDKRVRKAAKPAELTNKAARIAAAVSGERTATRPLLQGMINNSVDTNATIQRLERELQSTQAKFDNVMKKKGKGGATNVRGGGNDTKRGGDNDTKRGGANPTAKNGRGGGKNKAAASNGKPKKSNNQRRATASGNDDTESSSNKGPNRSNNSSSKNGQGSKRNSRK